MNYFNVTEKSLKRYLKTKVKITMATVVGFLIAGTVAFGATYDGEYTNKDIAELGSSKFVTGKDGNLTIQTNGSAYLLLKDLKNAKSLNEIRAALAQNGLHGSYVDETNQGNYVITGALAGEGRYSEGVKNLQSLGNLGNMFLKNPTLDKVLGVLDRTNTNDGTEISGNTNTVIGTVDGSSSPVVLGLIGGDMAVGVGKIDVDTSGLLLDKGATIISSKEKENLTITRNGDSTVTLESGNLIGGSVGSTAISLGNIGVEAELVKKQSVPVFGEITVKVIADLDLDGNSTANINGNTTLNINGTSNAAGVTAGGLATAIGGTVTSNVNGNTTININSIVDGGQHIDGITAGIFGGGMAISTLGGSANANTTGKTEINVEKGLSVGLVGGGLAVATDASQYIEDKNGDGVTTIDPDGLPPITISGLNDGGTSTVKSGDVDINLSGDSSAAVVLGSGVAISHQNSPQGKVPTENDKISTSTVEVGNTNIVIDVNKNIGENKEEIPAILTAIKGIIKQENLVDNVQTIVENTKDKGIVFGVAGNGIAMGADKGVSTVTANNTNIDLQNGYVVGVLGNGISTGNAWTKSTTEVKEKAKIDINGAEVIGISGNGMAIYYGAGNYDGSLGFDGKVVTKVKDSEINVNSGSVDGVFGGGIAIDDSQVDKTNAEAITSGTSTINVTGGYVKDFGYEHLNGIMGTTAPAGTQDIKAYYKEVKALGDGVAIFGGGVAAGNMANVSVANSVINVFGGKIDGDIVAGGIATAGAISTVENSTINIKGGEINGSLYGQGKATELDAQIGSVTESGKATVTNSNLVIDGYKGTIKSINDFHNITVGENTELTTNGISVIAKVDEKTGEITTRGNMVNNGIINISENNGQRVNRTLVSLKDSDLTNNGTMGVYAGDVVSSGNGQTTNTGKIQVLDKTAEELKDIDVSTLFGNEFSSTGMLVDKDGNVALDKDDIVIGNKDLTTEEVNKNDGAYLASGVTISGKDPINTKSLNIIGNVATKEKVKIDGSTVNIADNGFISLGDSKTSSDLTISSAVVNGNSKEGSTDVVFENDSSSLTLDNTTFNGVIGNDKDKGTLNSLGNSLVNGSISVDTINIGGTSKSRLDLALNTKIDTNKININKDGQLGLVIDNQGNNALKETSGITITGQEGDTGDISIITGNLAGEDVTINVGDNTFTDVDGVTDSDLYILENKDIIGTSGDNIDTEIVLKYNNNYFEGNSILNNINIAAKDVSNYFSSDKAIREQEMDTLYAENIYSETVRATYDTIKLNEKLVLSTNINNEVGKWAAVGNGVYNKSEYDKTGTIGKDYRTEIETSGLMGVMEYGLSADSSVGVVLSGALQDVDTAGGSADGTLLYLGTYAKKNIGNYRLIAGLGYQYGDYDADNTAAKIDSSDSYKTNALSAYIEGRYSMDLGDNLAIEPKLKLGYTYIDQDDVEDAYFGLEDANISTFDAEIGADLVKSINLKDGKLDVVFGASYVRTMGDTDKDFTGSFRAKNGRNKFDVIGVNLPENTGKFDLSVEVSKDSGLFYNGGVFLQTGNDDNKNYGVNVGIGYRF